MSRERVACVALRAYPQAARAARGEEMLATLLDASAGSRMQFARELADLVRLGLRARATQTASVGTRRLIADGLCLAGAWLLTLDLSTLLSQRARGLHDPLLAWPSIALLAAVLAMALVGLDRVAGAGALAWTALRLPELMDHHAVVGINHDTSVPARLFLAAAPAVLAVAITRTRNLRRRGPV